MAPDRYLRTALIDYAGLFPPAGLALESVVQSYAEYRESAAVWQLGRLIVPVARLAELSSLVVELPPPSTPWPISLLLSADSQADQRAVAEFTRRVSPYAVIDSAEITFAAAGELNAGLGWLAPDLEIYVELPLSADHDLAPTLATLAAHGLGAKLRCGGVTTEAFPAPDLLLTALQACLAAGVPFKATAGLHHPLRGNYRLTYAPDSPHGPMYGFLNLLLACAVIRQQGTQHDALSALLESEAATFSWQPESLHWREFRFSTGELLQLRQQTMRSFGSCSFREPVDEFNALFGKQLGEL